MSEWQVEMLWRCTSCSTQNRGRALACGKCGSPKDGSESYEMPSDVSEHNAVTDASLLAVARGGANWSCQYCQSDVRRRDGACGRCGAGEILRQAASPGVRQAASPARRRVAYWPYALAAAAIALVGVIFIAVIVRRPRPRAYIYTPPEPPAFVDHDAVVTSRSWKRTVVVERYQLWPFEGFAETKPADATEVKDLGQRVHHHDNVLDGHDTQTWTEQVQDGYDSQSYTASESCGQTCVPRPQNCSPVCTPNKNGFSTCRNVCTGGGQSCSTKYCTVTKQKQVPRFRSVTKSKQVPRYRKEPRYAAFYSWQAKAWRKVRTLDKEGADDAPAWPTDAEIALTTDERKSSTQTYEVRFTYAGIVHVHTPGSEGAFLMFTAGSKHRMRVHRFGQVELLSPDAGN